MPSVLALVLLEILDDEMILANYLGETMDKLKKMASRFSTSDDDDKDMEVLFGSKVNRSSSKKVQKKADNVDMDEEKDSVSFEEVLLLRLIFEITDAIRQTRSQAFVERLDEIVPEFDEYRRIIMAILALKEDNLPKISSFNETQIKPYPAGQVGFTRRAILGEMVKFSLHLNHSDETIRNNLISLFFLLISKIEYSYADYEHLLRSRRLMITDTRCFDKMEVGDLDDIEGLDASVDFGVSDYKQDDQD